MPAYAVPNPPWATGAWSVVWEDGSWGASSGPVIPLTICTARNQRLTAKRENESISPVRRNARLTPKRKNEKVC